MTETLRIRLLGTFHVRYGDEAVGTLRSTRVQELLAYLVLHAGSPQSRQHLAFQFWPDSTEGQARTNLRKVIHSLLQYLPHAADYVRVDPSEIEWLIESDYSQDVSEVTHLLQDADKDPLNVDLLKEAVDLYEGELLPHCYEEWLMALRRQLEQRILTALEQLVSLLEKRRAYDEGMHYAQRLVAMDPLREASYLSLMHLHALSGDRTGAMRVYHECTTVLRRELDADPGPELILAYQRMNELEVQAEQPGESLEHMSDNPVLVGRAREWEHLNTIWERAVRGNAQMAVVSGEAGFGKTRLAEELFQRADRLGAIAVRTRSFASHSDLVYAPIAELLRQDAFSRQLEKLDEVWLTEIARLLPELVESGRISSAPQPMTEAWQQQRLLQALVRAVTVSDHPILLLFDDLQWCDRETLQWLQYLLHESSRARLLVVGTVRSEEVDAQHPYTSLQLDLMRDGRFTEIPVTLLDRRETLTLAEQVAEEGLSPEQEEAIWAISSGNPLFVVETIRYWLEGDTHGMQASASESAAPKSTVEQLPPAVYSVIRSRFMQLSSQAQKVISLAATVGRTFSYPMLAAAGRFDEADLLDSLDELLRRRIVLEAGEVYDFSHDRIRDVAYAEISGARRRLLHGRVAAAIESIYAGNLDEVSGELAYQHEQAGNRLQAVDYLLSAGQRVAAQFANDEAVAYYTRALALIPETEPEKRIEVLLMREAVYTLLTDSDRRREDLTEMLQLAESLDGEPNKINRIRAQIGMRRVRFVGYQGDYLTAIRLVEETIELAQACDSPDIEMECYWHWGRELWAIGRFEDVKKRLRQGLQLAESLSADNMKANMLAYLAAADFFTGAPTSHVLHQLQQCLEINTQADNLIGQTDSHNRLGFANIHGNDDLVAARDHWEQALQITDITGDWDWKDEVGSNLAYISLCEGDTATSERLLRNTIHRTLERGHQFQAGIQLAYLGYSFANRGENHAAASLLEAIQVLEQASIRHYLSMALVFYAQYHLYTGNEPAAEKAARKALEISRELHDVRREGEALVCLGHSLAVQGRLDEAKNVYANGLALHRRMERTRSSLEALSGLARVAEQMGETEQATTHLEQILQDLDAISSFATEESFRIYRTCYQLLRQRQDPRAANLLALAHHQLQKRAASLADTQQEELFWGMPGHREIERAWRTRIPS